MRYKTPLCSLAQHYVRNKTALFLIQAIRLFKSNNNNNNTSQHQHNPITKQFLFRMESFVVENRVSSMKRRVYSFLGVKIVHCGHDQNTTQKSTTNNQQQQQQTRSTTQNNSSNQSSTSNSSCTNNTSAFLRMTLNNRNDDDDDDDRDNELHRSISLSSSHETETTNLQIRQPIPLRRPFQSTPTTSVISSSPSEVNKSLTSVPLPTSSSLPVLLQPLPVFSFSRTNSSLVNSLNNLSFMNTEFFFSMQRFNKLMQWAETLDAMPYEVQATIWSYCPHTPHLATFKTTLQHWALDPIPNMNHSNALYNAVLFVYHQLLQEECEFQFSGSNQENFLNSLSSIVHHESQQQLNPQSTSSTATTTTPNIPITTTTTTTTMTRSTLGKRKREESNPHLSPLSSVQSSKMTIEQKTQPQKRQKLTFPRG